MLEPDEEADLVLGQTTSMLDRRGDREAVQLLVDVARLDFESTDDSFVTNTGWSDHLWAAVLYVEEHILPSFTDDIRGRIAETLIDVAVRNGHSSVDRMLVKAVLPDIGKDWRETLRQQVLERPTNQGRRERAVGNTLMEDGLALGSRQELQVYRALKSIQAAVPPDRTIAIAPLAGVRLQAGHTWTPDLMVLGNGRAVIFEVDGPHHRDKRRYADDRNRDLQWQRCGVQVVRLPVEDLAETDHLVSRLKEELGRHLWPR
ncbi:hypothetical protein ACIHCQ_42405 [Streptomyces sp. NPDC052236]|uniref:hypothetical protein n=1 Tax=Streptomyces sp. NPDC052236 TaxID=3365686 RepID=UPI0037CDE09E